jgi:hypothetical protein
VIEGVGKSGVDRADEEQTRGNRRFMIRKYQAKELD